ncbi:amylo-alpha-1,6-glucosidase [Lysobacter helvus]|uniref:Amylo-alpha-1,6-glucosidase n=2 Tax=Lysobacteraceae TaxID=32033 RepID=A0ABN6FRP8_9GAMM|nr:MULTISPECIES: amylo-alpha-1,6-glucosidase [Lysobacter]BCT92328.1 amylo-alpha-1,6-glucosidase [Lysobacter caseinilyticus]BCT95481.1 amylo-alpha-1,6-glucosidase [Lysobacter helvus]
MSMDPAATAALYASHVLKDGDSFLVANGYGDIEEGSTGMFRDDTRLLSIYRLRLGETVPALLSAAVTEDNVFFLAHLTNRQLPPLGGSEAPQGLVHILRSRFLHDERMYERLAFMNYGNAPLTLPVRIELGADFRDMFEVRGMVRPARGELLSTPHTAGSHTVEFRYRGLDQVMRASVVAFSREAHRVEGRMLEFLFPLVPGEEVELFVEVGSEAGPVPSRATHRTAAAQARRRMRSRGRRGARVRSNGPLFDAWMQRSRADLALLTSELETGPYPYAGIPWFSTPFGRDAVITALQTLWLDPGIARGVLGFLAAHQAQEESSFLDSAPGKIMHETRKGEMAAMKELPFGRYYGGVDTTPLFVMLAGAYARRTGEMAFVDRLWPALRAATGWIERVCDANANGFLDYARGESTGLSNQGWKDSEDSVFHADGKFPPGPIALVEVQGYAYAAFRAMSELAGLRGEIEDAQRWDARANRLRETVEARYWMEDRGFYGIAVDGKGALCEVRASNPGHLLFCGLPDPARAASVAAQLMLPEFHTGWGVRTLALGEARYNPMSYHNGSIWPHDTALCAAGIARYGHRDAAVTLLRSAFESAVNFDMRLPELFCGFPRVQGAPPIAYPVACLPQAWAAGAPFMLLQACLGVEIDGLRGEISVDRPRLPIGIDEVRLLDVALGNDRVDLRFRRIDGRVAMFVDGRGDRVPPVRLRN